MVLNPYLYDDSEVELEEPDLTPVLDEQEPPPPLPFHLLTRLPLTEELLGRRDQKNHG
jgi:hypothetical protein